MDHAPWKMGNYYAKTFVRQDNIEGRGKVVLKNAKEFGLRKEELDALYSEYYMNPVANNGTINVTMFLARAEATMTPLSNIIFQFFDVEKNNRLGFNEYLVMLWCTCTLKEYDFIQFIFEMFDTNQSRMMEIEEVKLMIHYIWGFVPNPECDQILQKLELNTDGKVCVEEVVLLYKHHKMIFKPAFDLQEALRKNIVSNFYWKRIIKRRYKMFHSGRKKNDGLQYLSIFQLIDDYPKDRVSYNVTQNLHYLYKLEGVPRERYDEWVHILQNKVPLDLMLPIEMYEVDLEAAENEQKQEEKMDRKPKFGMHSADLFSKVKLKGGLLDDPDDILNISGINKEQGAYQTVEQKDKIRLYHNMKRCEVRRTIQSIADFQREMLERYYPEKPYVFPIHPYPPPSDTAPLYERVGELSKFTDGEVLPKPEHSEQLTFTEDDDF